MRTAFFFGDDLRHGGTLGRAGWRWSCISLFVVAAPVFVAVLATRAARFPLAREGCDDEAGRRTRIVALERYALSEISADEYGALLQSRN